MRGAWKIHTVEKDKEKARSYRWRLSSNSKDKNYKSDASKEVEKAGVVALGSKSEKYTEQEGASGS